MIREDKRHMADLNAFSKTPFYREHTAEAKAADRGDLKRQPSLARPLSKVSAWYEPGEKKKPRLESKQVGRRCCSSLPLAVGSDAPVLLLSRAHLHTELWLRDAVRRGSRQRGAPDAAAVDPRAKRHQRSGLETEERLMVANQSCAVQFVPVEVFTY
jgi:hypothetical protein